MPYQANIDQIQRINSTTYADKLGLLIGLDRLSGETSSDYLLRLETAVHLRREHPYEGAFNEMNLQLGFEPKVYIRMDIAPTDIVTISIAGVKIGTNPIVPLLTFDIDSMWKWRSLSEVTGDLNSIVSTTLLVDDGPAFQLARQSNSLWAFAEGITGIQHKITHSGLIIGSELFNQRVPSYAISTNGLITFEVEPDAGTHITYNYVIAPYEIVGAPISLIGFKDAEFASVANSPDGSLAYQIREFIQALMLVDRSYWAK